jgi:hypothetical protein
MLVSALGACRGEQAAPLPGASSPTREAPPPTSIVVAPKGDDLHAGSTAVGTAAISAAPAVTAAPRVWSFDADTAGGAPAGFSFARTGSGAPGRWIVQAEPGAPSGGSVLAQVSTDGTDSRFPVAVADAPQLADARVSVRCKPVSGSIDQACGLVFRYRDENNYYLTRANALEANVNLYVVKDGHRRELLGWNGTVASKTWHELRVDARGDHLEVYWERKKVIDRRDATFTEAGKIGVWTKADSVTYFDDLTVLQL